MEMIFMKRGEGKTTKLICMSYLNKIPIVVSNLKQAEYIKNKANSMGLEIPDPIGANINSLSEHLLGTGIKEVYVDNAEFMFKNLFEETFRVKLGGFSMSTDDTIVW